MRESNSSRFSRATPSDSPIALAVARLQQRLTRQIERNIFCTAGPLAELAIHARDVRRDAISAEQRVLAFVLETTLGLLASDQDGRAVNVSEIDALKRLFLDPITRAVTFLAGKGGDPIVIADSLVAAMSKALPLPG